MAIYHLSVKPVSRSKGQSATASAAYRSATRIKDERTGEVWDFRRKRGVVHRELVLPAEAPRWAHNRERLWNAAEAAETRKNSTVAREFEVALPTELRPNDRRRLAMHYARAIAERHRCAVDVAIHVPGRAGIRATTTRTCCARHDDWGERDSQKRRASWMISRAARSCIGGSSGRRSPTSD
jgi:hypothetical protein